MLRIRELLFDEWNEEHIIRREMRHKQNGACISVRENKMDEQKKSQIPEFKTIAEEAAFWDTHDTTDFEDEFEEIEVEFEAPLLKRGLTIVLDEPYLSQLEEAAERQHRPAATLAREWLIERLEVTKV